MDKVRKIKLEKQIGKGVTGLGIDGRKDPTLIHETVMNESGETVFSRNVSKKMENVTVISSPDYNYIGHFNPVSGRGEDTRVALFELLERRGVVYKETLSIVNLDGTATNNG